MFASREQAHSMPRNHNKYHLRFRESILAPNIPYILNSVTVNLFEERLPTHYNTTSTIIIIPILPSYAEYAYGSKKMPPDHWIKRGLEGKVGGKGPFYLLATV